MIPTFEARGALVNVFNPESGVYGEEDLHPVGLPHLLGDQEQVVEEKEVSTLRPSLLLIPKPHLSFS